MTQFPGFWTDATIFILLASASIKQGEIACNASGKAQPLTDTLMQAGATLLGMAPDDYVDTTGVDVTRRMTFMRNCTVFIPNAKAGDVPAVANVGGLISLQNKNTVKATITGTDAVVTLLEIVPGGGYRVALS